MLDQAALSLGLVSVPLHPTDNPSNVGLILRTARLQRSSSTTGLWTKLAPKSPSSPA